MKVVLAGGSGQVGTMLARGLTAQGHDIVVLSRNRNGGGATKTEYWDACSLGSWTDQLAGASAIINLAGRTVNCRYTAENQRLIKESRVASTSVIGQAIQAMKKPPDAWLQMSTATIYAHRFDAANDEYTGIIGGSEADAPQKWRFSIEVAKAWEGAVDDSHPPESTRVVKLRTSVVMSADRGGIFDVLSSLVKCGLGGASGDGRQYVSWIEDTDFVRAIQLILETDTLSGPVNLAAPEPLPNEAFMRAIRQAYGMPFGLPASNWMLELGAIPLQTETELLLKSRRVVPTKLLQAGFTFAFPAWPDAAKELVKRMRI